MLRRPSSIWKHDIGNPFLLKTLAYLNNGLCNFLLMQWAQYLGLDLRGTTEVCVPWTLRLLYAGSWTTSYLCP